MVNRGHLQTVLAIGIGFFGAMLGGCRAPAFSKVETLQDLVVAEAGDNQPAEPEGEVVSEMPLELHASLMENLEKGGLEENSGRPDQAARYYYRILRVDPSHAEAHQRLARLSAEAEDYRQSERHYRMALEKYPESARLWEDLAHCLAVQNRPDEAKEALRRSVHLSTRAVARREMPWKVVDGWSDLREPTRLDVARLEPTLLPPTEEHSDLVNRQAGGPPLASKAEAGSSDVRQSSTFPVEVARRVAKPYLPRPVIQQIYDPERTRPSPFALASLDQEVAHAVPRESGVGQSLEGSGGGSLDREGVRAEELPLWTLPSE